MSLSLGNQPGFTAIADTTFDAGNPITDTLLKQMNDNGEFAVVRNEQFYGYYANGETVVLPVSTVDGYQYSRSELVYSWSIYWTGSAIGGTGGQMTAPPKGGTTQSGGGGTMLQMAANVDQASGLVSCGTSYYKSAESDTTDGILCVITHAQRSR
jgi:hypothetical protein